MQPVSFTHAEQLRKRPAYLLSLPRAGSNPGGMEISLCRELSPEEIVSCLPYLQRQIELINPEIIVALGAHAARTLLDTNKPIGQLRGQFHEYFAGLGSAPIKLMATYHPAYLLRSYSPENRRKVWEDMKKVLAELNLPIPEQPNK